MGGSPTIELNGGWVGHRLLCPREGESPTVMFNGGWVGNRLLCPREGGSTTVMLIMVVGWVTDYCAQGRGGGHHLSCQMVSGWVREHQ